MAVQISCRGLGKSYTTRPLFEGLTFGLFDGERTGLIGPNGTGKSTLLKILAGQETPDDGEVIARRGLRVGYLTQQDRFDDPGETSVRRALERALDGLGLEDYEVDQRVEEWLDRASFGDPDQLVSALSGGWRKRLALLVQIIREPDLLLMDEPTNHLDLDGVLWLEKLMGGIRFSYLVVTHDRRFLERVANRVIELDKRYPDGHFSARGNYSAFLEAREAFLDQQAAREDSVRNIVRGEIEWLRKGPKARTTKQQARIDRAGELMGELAGLEYRSAQARAADIDFSGSERRTSRLVEAFGVEKTLGGRKLFGPLDVRLGPGDKLGLLGANGSGKSTLLKILTGELAPDAGEVKRAERLKIASFAQDRGRLDQRQSLKRALCEAGEHVEYKGSRIHVYGWAARFLFRQDQLEKPVSTLSGGEQARVLIAKLMLEPADLLLLDEPTNDLDLRSLEVLENSLKEFPGALILVTHDRYLLDRVSKELLWLDGAGGARFFADLSQWETARAAQKEPGRAARPEPAAAPLPLSPKEAKELKGMEAAIRLAELEAERAEQALHDPAVAADAGELAKRQARLDEARGKVDALYARWDELEKKR